MAAAALERLGEVSRETGARVAAWRAAIGARARLGAELSSSFDLFQRIAEAGFRLTRLRRRVGHLREDGDPPGGLAAGAHGAHGPGCTSAASDEAARALRLWELALVQAELGLRAAAIEQLERARELMPELTPVLWMLARLRVGVGVMGLASARPRRRIVPPRKFYGIRPADRARRRAPRRRSGRRAAIRRTVRDDEGAARPWKRCWRWSRTPTPISSCWSRSCGSAENWSA